MSEMNLTPREQGILESPAAQPVLRRVGSAIGDTSRSTDRVEHAKRVALTVLAARGIQ